MGAELTELKPFQLEGVYRALDFGGRVLNCDEMGLGKTLQTLFWVLKFPRRRPVVIVTPASLKWNWHSEASLHFNLRTVVLEGFQKPGQELPPGEIYILNYEILGSWLKALQRIKPQILCFDEVHFIKNRKAKRTRNCFKLAKGKHVRNVFGLSGTPLTNRHKELWSVIKVVRPDLFPSWEDFAWQYCKPRWTPWGWNYNGNSNSKELHKILRKEVMIRRLKKDVLPELPDKIRQAVSFRLPPKLEKEYLRAEQDFIAWLSTKSLAKANRAKKSPALTKVGYLLRYVAELKLKIVEDWIKDFFEAHPGEKLIALTMHTFVIEHLRKVFPQAVVVNGSVTGRKRFEVVQKFQSNPRTNLFLGNWKAAGVGINLTAAWAVAVLDFPWNPADLLQGEDRAHRIGQKNNVVVFYLMMLRTIEEKLVRILQKKSRVLDAVLDGKGQEDEIDIFEELLKTMKKGLL